MAEPEDKTFIGYVRHKFESTNAPKDWKLNHLNDHFSFGIIFVLISIIFFVLSGVYYDVLIFVVLGAFLAIAYLIEGCGTIYVGKFNDVQVMMVAMFINWLIILLSAIVGIITLILYFVSLTYLGGNGNFTKYTPKSEKAKVISFIVVPVFDLLTLFIIGFYVYKFQVDEVYHAVYTGGDAGSGKKSNLKQDTDETEQLKEETA